MKFYFVISLLLSLAVITTNDPYDFDVIEDTSSDHRGAVRMRDGNS
uniref:Uncharacterized protein n=1 Tax=Schistosoma mansoni TaxID=6183 RepID=A0A5K4FA57_SCHMA